MALLKVLSVLALVQSQHAWRAFPGGYLPNIRHCTTTHCHGYEWKDDWAPSRNIRPGTCVRQTRQGHALYTTMNYEAFSCISSMPCTPQLQLRTMCSCQNAYYCPFHSWSGWSGSIAQGSCGRQSRYRDYNQHTRYDKQSSNCNGISSSCGPRQYAYRDLCRCRYAQCTLNSWSSWADLSSPVSASHCASRRRTRSYTLSWLYTDRLNNCNGVTPQSCPSTYVENGEKIVTCPSLPKPSHGSWHRDDCNTNTQVCRSVCQLRCDTVNGFQIQGANRRECLATGQWSTPWSSYCKDQERPRLASCPKDVKKQTNQNSIRVTWEYPVFEDNFDRPPVQLRINSNRNPGALFPWGKNQVLYTANDRAGNKATCKFFVEVGPVPCTFFDPPAYGIRSCNKKTVDSNGVLYEMVCVIQCKQGYAFADQAVVNTYFCQSDGTWNRVMFGGHVPVPVFPKSQRPWPDCAPEQNANAAKKNFTFYTGSCSGNEQEALTRIRLNFLNAVKNSLLAKYALCDVSKGLDCVVENVKVYCGANSRKRSVGNERIITLDFVMSDKNVSSDPKEEAAKVTKMMGDLDTLADFVKNNFPNDAHMPDMQVSVAASSVACPAGKVIMMVPGNNSELERTICVECPAGSYYNKDTRTCHNCQEGTFQNRTGQVSCDPCPAGTWTVGGHARNFTECFEICEPGEFMMHEESGIINCIMCPLGTYQPRFRASKCEQCPSGKTTLQKASTTVDDCQ